MYLLYLGLLFVVCAGLGWVGVTPNLARLGGMMCLPVLRVTGFLYPLSGKVGSRTDFGKVGWLGDGRRGRVLDWMTGIYLSDSVLLSCCI